MTTYVLTYDLNKEETSDDYKPLIDELKRLKAHRYQFSAWLINLNNTAKEAHDHFKGLMDKNDALWVSELTKTSHYSGAKAGTTKWLEDNPPAR
ncbi:CRISPR-associated protein Cas2 [Mesorhizobium sp.]|uniref:CRISPR-associated protein Cas2 n=1 Tax=Mesorhizobium sp. TaxID=1871066 RepID=UPI001225B006|nr:CRISPR-associated protein Cas2 [Mesorhizobium sp.]TIN80717.1 MAG: CRISPR-associated protein Cas2 [Mesorhizobium sp.]